MKQVLVVLVFMTACASFSAPMVLKEKRDLNMVEGSVPNTNGGAASTNGAMSAGEGAVSTKKKQEICAPQTPCAWSTYNEITKAIIMNITNTYCVCGPGTECYSDEDDKVVFSYVYRCRKPTADGDKNSVSKRNS